MIMTLKEAPKDKLLRIIKFDGNFDFVKKLTIIDIHIDDEIIKISSARLGPIIVLKKSDSAKLAIGKEYTDKIIVEISNENT